MNRIFKHLIFVILGLLSNINIFAFEVVVDSRIIGVTVYPDSALINRLASLKLNSGEQQVVFSNIIPEVDDNSLRVSVVGTAQVKILGARIKKEFLEEVSSEKVKKLKDEIQKLEDEVKNLQNIKDLLLEKKSFLNSIRLFSQGQIPKELVTKMPSVKELEEILKFLDSKLRENYTQVMEIEINLRELNKKLDVLKRELVEISGPARKLKRSIVVDLEVLKAGSFDLVVSYLVKGTSWQPIYDARSNFEKSEVEIISYGIVRQTTGEDWQDVEISLSTAKPAIGGRMPYVSPWFLKPYYHQPLRSTREDRSRGLYQTEAFAPTENFRDINLAVEYARVEEKGIAVVYRIPRRTSIKSDGSEHKLLISSQILKADFTYSTYPRVSNFVYLGSRVTNSKDLQLLAGRVNIFLEGDFVGTSSIDNIGPGEEFDLYLGVDENVKVKREQIEKKVDDILIAGIPAPTLRITFKYKTTIENYKNKKIKIIFFEAMPVSENEQIKVNISNVSLEPNKKNWKDRKGVWCWELELEPKEKKDIFYTFSIEHPRNLKIEGL